MDFDQKEVFNSQLRLDLKLFSFSIIIGLIY